MGEKATFSWIWLVLRVSYLLLRLKLIDNSAHQSWEPLCLFVLVINFIFALKIGTDGYILSR